MNGLIYLIDLIVVIMFILSSCTFTSQPRIRDSARASRANADTRTAVAASKERLSMTGCDSELPRSSRH
jgi:hypothetical protein